MTIRQGHINRRVKTTPHHLRYRHMSGYLGMFCSDTFKANVTSLRGNKYSQLFYNRGNFTTCYPIKKKSDAHHALDSFIHDIGIPEEILTDNAGELHLGEWGKTCRRRKIRQLTTEPHSPWQNHAELVGSIVQRKVHHLMKTINTLVVLWDYCWEYITNLRCYTVTDLVKLEGLTPFEWIFKYTPDIAEYAGFTWFQWVVFHDYNNPNKERLGRWLGPTIGADQGISYRILTEEGKVLSRSTVHHIVSNIHNAEAITNSRQDFIKKVESIIGNHSNATCHKYDEEIDADNIYDSLFNIESDALDDENVEYQELDENGVPIQRPDVDLHINDAPSVEDGDKYINMKVLLPREGSNQEATVKRRKRLPDGTLKDTASDQPILDTRVYKVEFGDGTYADYCANVLIENLYVHIDDNGASHDIIK